MRYTVFGSTGATGLQLVEQAVAAGHQVTAVVRDPARLTVRGADVVRADVMDPASLVEAVTGADAVFSALGIRPGSKDPVSAPGTRSIMTAMRTAGTRRLLVVTASGHVIDPNDTFVTARLLKPVLRRVLRVSFADFAETEQIVRAGDLDWTILRPPRLTNGGHRPYRTETDRTVRGGQSISRADLARALLAAAADPSTVGHAIAVGY